MPITDNDVVSDKPSKSTDKPSKNSDFICHSEVKKNGKVVHYLYNPNEKDARKAWKASETCSK